MESLLNKLLCFILLIVLPFAVANATLYGFDSTKFTGMERSSGKIINIIFRPQSGCIMVINDTTGNITPATYNEPEANSMANPPADNPSPVHRKVTWPTFLAYAMLVAEHRVHSPDLTYVTFDPNDMLFGYVGIQNKRFKLLRRNKKSLKVKADPQSIELTQVIFEEVAAPQGIVPLHMILEFIPGENNEPLLQTIMISQGFILVDGWQAAPPHEIVRKRTTVHKPADTRPPKDCNAFSEPAEKSEQRISSINNSGFNSENSGNKGRNNMRFSPGFRINFEFILSLQCLTATTCRFSPK